MKQHSKHLWNEQPAYKKWVKARDRALEELHTRGQQESADVMRKVLTDTLIAAKANYEQMKSGHPFGVESFEHLLKGIFSYGSAQLYHIMITLRARSYTLAKASEAEIIARMSRGNMVHANVRAEHLHQARHRNTVAGGAAVQRLNHYMDRMRRKIVSFAQGAALNAPDVTAFLQDVQQSFPRKRIVRRPKRILKPQLMEADKPGPWDNWSPPPLTTQTLSEDPPADVAIDNIDDAAWQDMLDAYMTDYVPQWRDPAYVVDLPISDPTVQADGTEVWYAWEFERDMTNEFVQAVRDGQIGAANENGITDFVWIAVVDSVTDDCCLWRDGLLVSEIEEQLGDHEDEDSACDVEDGLTPPIHFNCRCTLAPATDNIPDKPETMASEFSEWLET